MPPPYATLDEALRDRDGKSRCERCREVMESVDAQQNKFCGKCRRLGLSDQVRDWKYGTKYVQFYLDMGWKRNHELN